MLFPSPSRLSWEKESLLARLCAMRCQGTAKWTLFDGTCERQKEDLMILVVGRAQNRRSFGDIPIFRLDEERICVYSAIMAMDPVRLARIRARVLAAATLTVPAVAGCSSPHVNERPQKYINIAPPDQPPPKEKEVTPINERKPDQPTPDLERAPEPKHINTPAPDTTAANIPPPGQTINTAPTKAPEPDHVNTPPPLPTAKPTPQPKHINTPAPTR